MTNEAEPHVVPIDDESDDSEANAREPDHPDGSFVVLFEDEESGESEAISGSNIEENSFVILFDDLDSSVSDENTISFNDEGHCTITLPSDIRVRHISSFKSELEKSIDADEVTYDLTQVKYVDTASVQLLHAHRNALKDLQVKIHWTGVSNQFSMAAESLGFNFFD